MVLPQNVQLHSLRSKSSFHTSSVSVLTFTLIFYISVLRPSYRGHNLRLGGPIPHFFVEHSQMCCCVSTFFKLKGAEAEEGCFFASNQWVGACRQEMQKMWKVLRKSKFYQLQRRWPTSLGNWMKPTCGGWVYGGIRCSLNSGTLPLKKQEIVGMCWYIRSGVLKKYCWVPWGPMSGFFGSDGLHPMYYRVPQKDVP